MDKKKVVICGSIKSSSDELFLAAKTFEHLGFEVTEPVDFNKTHESYCSLGKIMGSYIKEIESSDLVVIVAKTAEDRTIIESYPEAEKMILTFGESTIYETVLAAYMKKPIVIWGGIDNKEV